MTTHIALLRFPILVQKEIVDQCDHSELISLALTSNRMRALVKELQNKKRKFQFRLIESPTKFIYGVRFGNSELSTVLTLIMEHQDSDYHQTTSILGKKLAYRTTNNGICFIGGSRHDYERLMEFTRYLFGPSLLWTLDASPTDLKQFRSNLMNWDDISITFDNTIQLKGVENMRGRQLTIINSSEAIAGTIGRIGLRRKLLIPMSKWVRTLHLLRFTDECSIILLRNKNFKPWEIRPTLTRMIDGTGRLILLDTYIQDFEEMEILDDKRERIEKTRNDYVVSDGESTYLMLSGCSYVPMHGGKKLIFGTTEEGSYVFLVHKQDNAPPPDTRKMMIIAPHRRV